MDNNSLYRTVCAQKTSVPIFLQPWWLDVVGPSWQAAIVQKGEHCAGIWPYVPERKAGVQLLRTPLLTPYFGPYVFFPSDMKDSNRDSFEHDTIAALMDQIPASPVWALSMPPGLKQVGLFKSRGLEVHVKQTFLVDLIPDDTIQLSRLKDSIRRNIKAAQKEVTITNDPSYLPQLFKYQKDTLTRKNTMQPYTLKHMERLMDGCLANNAGALYVAKKGGEVLALVWNVWDKHTSYYFMGAQNTGSTDYTAMSALLWHVMAQSKLRGNEVFDLEGSMDPGVERFFRGFGGKRELYLTLQKNTSITWKIIRALRK